MITIDNEADIIASALPNGIVWKKKYQPRQGEKTSNLRKVILGIARIFNSMRYFEENVQQKELNIFTTEQLLPEYETLVNSNDGTLFPSGLTDDQRRRNIILKLTLPRIKNLKDLQDAIKTIFGVDVCVIINGISRAKFPYTFPIPFVGGIDQISKIVFVQLPKSLLGTTFPLPFPIPFEKTEKETIENLIRWISPVNKYIIFEYVL